jgi:DNA-binding XRE family transcriptional regulator
MSQATVPIDPKKFWQARDNANVSQYTLARNSGLSRSFVSDIENGRRQPRSLAAESLAKALGLTVEDLCISDPDA